MKSKIQVSFNQVQYEVNLKSLQENVNRYINYINAIYQITNSKQYKTLQEVEDYIIKQTSFKNVLLSAGLLDVVDSYKFIKENHTKMNIDVLDIKEDSIRTKQEVLEKIKEDATLYLDECFVDEYKLLVKATEYLNKLQSPNSSNFLAKDYNGKFKVNVMALQNSKRI
jgi:RNase adaptor protein for sRNA GlmZ degradation